MTQLCRQCRRLNPREATYCYFDGIYLEGPADGRAIDVAGRAFPAPFVFPSGVVCRTMNELAVACWRQAAETLELLRRGDLESFLLGMGRADLARAAARAARAADPERGFDEFLGRLPANALAGPRLRVEPALLDVGTLRIGEDRCCELVLCNKGQRLLTGSVRCGVPWLSLGDGPTTRTRLLQMRDRITLPVRVLGKRLRAHGKPQEGQIEVESNGGSVTVVVRVFVPTKPFPEGVLSGALSPRQVAHKAKEAPKEAALLIESGAVARWYEANGWKYPVQGPVASGVAAVQQLLEALGLVKPPQVELSEDSIRLRGKAGDRLEYSLAVITQENRAAIAHAASDQPWLTVGRTVFRGRCAFLPLAIPTVPPSPGATLQANLTVTANGGQHFIVPVELEVRAQPAPAPAPTHVPVVVAAPAAVPAPVPAPAKRAVRPTSKKRAAPVPQPVAAATPARRRRLLPDVLALVCVAAMGGLLFLIFRLVRTDENPPPAPPSSPGHLLTLAFQDDPKDKIVGAATMTFGLALPRDHKRLFFEERGRSNNVCYRVDGKDILMGYEGGSWQTLCDKLPTEGGLPGCRSIWVHKDAPIAFTQTVEIIKGLASGQPDTCLVRCTIENRDRKAHKVGLRYLLDTYIGSRDGVPFVVPGLADFCDGSCDRKGADVPDFLAALENDDLKNPGVVAQLGLWVSAGLEMPGRVTVTAWPDVQLASVNPLAQGNLTRWEVPLLPLTQRNDSAVTLYWLEKDLGPGARRAIGFRYGLGALATTENGRLALAADGVYSPGRELALTALVRAPASGETLTLEGPPGWALVSGKVVAPVPAPAVGRTLSLVTWKVRAADTVDRVRLRVRSSADPSQAVSVMLQFARLPG